MKSKNQYRYSNLLSLCFHIAVLVLFMFFTYEPEVTEDEFVSVGFGTFTKANSSGAEKTEVKPEDKPEIKKEPRKTEKKAEKPETKKVELPNVRNDDAEIINTKNKALDDKTNTVETNSQQETDTPPAAAEETDDTGKGDTGEDEGNAGFEIAWGGSGVRKIYSYELPAYPDGVSKQIDIKLRFTILPDGTVGRIIPLVKADTRLEIAAINSLKNWRFEPLREGQKKADQNVVIIFPYRLR